MTTRLLMTADAVGGVWQYAAELARALVPHGVETTVAVLGPEPSPDQLSILLHPCLEPGSRLPSGGHGATDEAEPRLEPGLTEGDAVRFIHTGLSLDWLSDGPDPVLAAGRAIADLARDLRADLVHLNSPTLAAAARFDRPVVAVAHGCVATWWRAANGTAPDPSYRWQADLMRRGLLAADAAIAPSASFAADLQRIYALPTAPQAIHNGRTPSSPSLLRNEGGEGRCETSTPAFHAFTAGRLWDRVKNVSVLDQVARHLSVSFRAAGPVTAPHGETAEPMHLHLLGDLPAHALAAELAVRPVFVSAATFEPFGLAVLEAAQAGCALVLSDIPTFRELWSGAALFVPADDPAAIAAAIESLLADPARREALARAARARSARYTPGATAAAMADLYGRLRPSRRVAA